MGDHRGRDVVHPRRKKKTNVLKSMWQGLKDEAYQDPQSCSNSHSVDHAKMESKLAKRSEDATKESEASQFTIKANKTETSGDYYKEKQPAKGYHSSPLSFFKSAAEDTKARRMDPQNATHVKRDKDTSDDEKRRKSQDISNPSRHIQGKCYKYDPESSSLREASDTIVVPSLLTRAAADDSGRKKEEISHDHTNVAGFTEEEGMRNQAVAKFRGQEIAIARELADEDKDVKKLGRQWKDVGILRPIQRHSHDQTLTAPAAVMDAEDAIARKLIREDAIRKQGKDDKASKGMRFGKALAGISKADAERRRSFGKHRVLMFLAPKRAFASESKIKAECGSSTTTSTEGQDDDKRVNLAAGIPMPKNPAGAYETAPNDTLTPPQLMRRQPQPQRHSLPPGAYPVAPATAQQEQEGEAAHLPATAREEESERSMADEEWTIRSSLPQAQPVQDEEEEESSSRLRQLQESFADQETQMEQMQQQLAQLQHVQAELAQFKQAMPKAEPVPRPANTNVGRPSLKQKKQRNRHRDRGTEKFKRPSGMTEKEWGAYQYLIGTKQQL